MKGQGTILDSNQDHLQNQIDPIIMENGKTRRNPKDSQSRDYACLCGKSYLSYAAAYTHTKNKHAGDKTFIDGIKKPVKEQLKRGRPKEKKVTGQTVQTALLTLIESTILKICEQLEGAFQKIVLQGNQERNNQLYQQTYKLLCQRYSDHFHRSNFGNQQHDFLDALIKDFRAEVAARVRFVASTLIHDGSSKQAQPKRLEQLNGLWNGKSGVNETVAQALQQWWKIKGKAQTEQQNFDYSE